MARELSAFEYSVLDSLVMVPQELGVTCLGSSDSAKIFVKSNATATGVTMIELDLEASGPIANTKAKFQFWFGIPPDQQAWNFLIVSTLITLITGLQAWIFRAFADMQLEDNCALTYYMHLPHTALISGEVQVPGPLYILVNFKNN